MPGLAASQSPTETRHAFDEFFVWRLYVRGTTIVLTFIAVTWARSGHIDVSLEIKRMGWSRQILMRMFGRPKGILGWLGGVIMARVNGDAAAQVIEMLNVRPDDMVLEIGFGRGVAIQLLLPRVPMGSVAGVDQSQEMVRLAAARNADALRNRRVDLRYGSAERICRVLKPGGIVALGFTVNSGQPKQGVAESLVAAGFTQAEIVDGSKLFCAIATTP
jgi:hypothetical protein